MTSQKHNIVIVGGGLSGVRAAKILSSDSRYDVTLISDSFFLNFRPQLYRTNNQRAKSQLHIKIQDLFKGRRTDIDLVRAKITDINPSSNKISSNKGIDYRYDSLILAFDREERPIDGFESSDVFSAYTFNQATQLRRRLISDFERGRPASNYVIVGAGVKGVQLACEVRHVAAQMAKRYKIDKSSYEIVLLDQSNMILPDVRISNTVRMKALQRLDKLDIKVILNTQATSVSQAGLHAGDKLLTGAVVIMAAGQVANRFFIKNRNHFHLDPSTYVDVTDLLEAEGHSNVYITGVCAESPKSGAVSTSLYDAEFVAKTISGKIRGRRVHEYNPPDVDTTIPMGGMWAIHKNGTRFYAGKRGWMLKRWIDLKHFSTLLSKRQLVINWLLGSNGDKIS